MGTTLSVGIGVTAVEPIALTSQFEDVYRREYPGLVAVATALTGDWRDGEDAVQDTMVRAFVRWDRVGGLERPGAWCHHVLVNICRSRWRRRRTEQRFWARARRAEAPIEIPCADVITFWEIVRELPSRPRTVVTLHFAGERTTDEVVAVESAAFQFGGTD